MLCDSLQVANLVVDVRQPTCRSDFMSQGQFQVFDGNLLPLVAYIYRFYHHHPSALNGYCQVSLSRSDYRGSRAVRGQSVFGHPPS